MCDVSILLRSLLAAILGFLLTVAPTIAHAGEAPSAHAHGGHGGVGWLSFAGIIGVAGLAYWLSRRAEASVADAHVAEITEREATPYPLVRRRTPAKVPEHP